MDSCSDIILFLKYYLSINSLIIEQQEFNKDQGLSKIETFIAGVSATSELNLPYYPSEDIIRYQELIDYLASNEKYGSYVKSYFKEIGVSSMIYGIWGLSYIIKIQQSKNIGIPICTATKKRDNILLDRFSNEPLLKGQSPLETVNAKKNSILGNGKGQIFIARYTVSN